MGNGMKILLSTLAMDCSRRRLGHLCCFALWAGLVACTTTTPGILVDAQSEVFSPVIDEDRKPKTVAVFLNWYQGCVFKECEAPRAELRDRAAACIQSGFQRVNADLRAIAGPVELRVDTSALVADPRKHGLPDSRFDTDLVANLQQQGVRYAVVLDITQHSGTPTQRNGAEVISDPQVPGILFSRSSSTPVHVRANATLIELDSRRWLARISRDFKDIEDHTVSVALAGVIPIPRIPQFSSSSAGLSACEAVGEALGYALFGKEGPRPFGEWKRRR